MIDLSDKEKGIRFNQGNLYREEVFTDLSTGAIRRMTPIKPEGEFDATRPVLFAGQSQLYTPQGPIPIQFPIEAQDLQGAIDQFAAAMESYIAHLMEEAEKVQREAQSRIIVPGGSSSGGSGIITP